jgi:hypothetical protein
MDWRRLAAMVIAWPVCLAASLGVWLAVAWLLAMVWNWFDPTL